MLRPPLTLRLNRPRRLPVVLLGSLLAAAYFTAHAISGTHGVLARHRLLDRQANIGRDVAGLEITRSRLQRDVTLLSLEPPHPDIVEEQARSILGMAYPADMILLDRR